MIERIPWASMKEDVISFPSFDMYSLIEFQKNSLVKDLWDLGLQKKKKKKKKKWNESNQ